MEQTARATSKISKQIKSIQETAMEFNEEQKQRKKYKPTCVYCQQHLLGRKQMKVGDASIDLESNGEGYCKLCEAKFCSQYPSEEICNQIANLKMKKISKSISELSLRNRANDNMNCKTCVKIGNQLKLEGKLSMDDDEMMKKSCIECKKTSCAKDVVMDEEEMKFCDFVNELIQYYLSYKKTK